MWERHDVAQKENSVPVNRTLKIDSYVVLMCVPYRFEEVNLDVLECKFHVSYSGWLGRVKVDVAGGKFNLGERNA